MIRNSIKVKKYVDCVIEFEVFQGNRLGIEKKRVFLLLLYVVFMVCYF